jgi:flagellar biosynthetic protein FliR
MELVFPQMLAALFALWWPFCRALAMLTMAPVLGDSMVPNAVRVLVALVLAVILLPVVQVPVGLNPWSARGMLLTAEQLGVGAVVGLALSLTMAAVTTLGFLVSSQMGLSMAVMNDPLNGSSSDVVSNMLYVLAIVVFFSVDGHMVLVAVLGESLRVWPVGGGIALASLQGLAFGVAWVFSAALLLALPIVFSALVVQIGFGLLNRIAPALNLFSLGFSVVTVFGLLMLTQMVRFLPEHYMQLTRRVLDLLRTQWMVSAHG